MTNVYCCIAMLAFLLTNMVDSVENNNIEMVMPVKKKEGERVAFLCNESRRGEL